ncbi:MAG: hypothetical protein EXR72_26000 [Myxococcales bacterium]|nr:hypothetical protein [Myxococcales bacterium]
MRKFLILIAFVAIVLPAALATSVAHAGGMFLPARGPRALGRAGSYVAGADDLEAIYYNPAGLAGTGHGSAMLDLGLLFQRVNYAHLDAGGVTQPGIDSDNALLPLPFLGVSWRPEFLARRVTLAFAAWAPSAAITRYPETGPQRYSLISLDGTAILVAELAVSIRITPELYFGGGFQNMYFSINNTVALSSCTQVNCAPEDPSFDAITQAKAHAPFTPSGNVGLLYVHPKFRIGASGQLPYWVRAEGTLRTRLPPDPQFDGAEVVGDKVKLDLNLPAVFRVGVEVRPTRQLRIEVGADYEMWQMQDKIRIVPQGVYIDHVVGIGRYDLRPLEIDRSMQGVFAAHIGGEYDVLPKRLTLRAGYLFESSSMPDETLSVLTPDGNKHLLALGVAVRLGPIRIDAAYGHFFQGDRVVTTSRSYQLNPIYPSAPVPVGNGTYVVAADVLSLGLEGRF